MEYSTDSYLRAARHAGALSELLTSGREHDEAAGAAEGGRLHCWGVVARIYREFHCTPWSAADGEGGKMGLARLIEYIWDGLDSALPNNALIAIVNAVYSNYLEGGGRPLLGMPAEERVWGDALDEWQRAGAKGALSDSVNWDTIRQ